MNYSWEYEYCSEKCWEGSEEYAKALEKMKRVLPLIPLSAIDDLIEIVNCNTDYTSIYIGMAESRKKELQKGDNNVKQKGTEPGKGEVPGRNIRDT
jgi:hypothetical protein